jgi:hypothetical protein
VAYVSAVLANFAFWAPMDARTRSRAAIERALSIDPNLPVAHATRGWWTALHEWNWPEAERLFRHTLSLDARCIEGHAFFGLMCGRYSASTTRVSTPGISSHWIRCPRGHTP